MRKGFTLIEIGLFLAITGLLVAGIMVSTNNSISQQRYNDTPQDFAEFLRGIYSKVSDPQGIDKGRSDQAIYGKLVTFGESVNLGGGDNNRQEIFTYDIIGDADGAISGSDVLAALQTLNANVVLKKDGDTTYTPAGYAEGYSLKWDATLQDTNGNDFYGAIMVVRSPMSGTVYTYVMQKLSNQTVEVNKAVRNQTGNPFNPLLAALSNFKNTEDVDFCISTSDDTLYGGKRRNVRLSAGARNSSSVEVIPLDDPSQNRCK